MRAQDSETEVQFWLRLLGRALAQLAATPDPLLPWLSEEVGHAETRSALMLTDPVLVCFHLVFRLCFRLFSCHGFPDVNSL